MNTFLVVAGLAVLIFGDALKTKSTAGDIDISFAGLDWPRISKGKVYFEPVFRFANYSKNQLTLSNLVIALSVKDASGNWKLLVKSPPQSNLYEILPQKATLQSFPLETSLLTLGLNFLNFLSSMEVQVYVQGEANGYPFSESFTKTLGKPQTINGLG
ncbi:hypothetical protein AAG747_14085 [Rapidithrix thailandica]|uniref:Uncharacterized protein n=1 Tax=Rapidithrix thailandica TaxID=413964 RepID=A0AAW9S9L4_9BACT